MIYFPKWLQRVTVEVLAVVFVFAVLHSFVIGPQISPMLMASSQLHINAQFGNSIKVETKQDITPSVPELVHFVWIYPPDTEFQFYQMVSILAVMRNIKPKGVIFWNNNRPTGKWWKFVRQIVPNMALWELDPVVQVYNKSISIPEHQSDIARIDILLKYGGIYLDFDVIMLKSINQFYNNKVTMGAENPSLLGSGIIIAERNATFLRLWKEAYKTFNDSLWNFHSVQKPMEIAKKNPSLIHIEWFGFHRPNWFEREWLYRKGKLWNWSENFAVHLWHRTHRILYDPVNIQCLNTTTGEILRYIYYGNDTLFSPC